MHSDSLKLKKMDDNIKLYKRIEDALWDSKLQELKKIKKTNPSFKLLEPLGTGLDSSYFAVNLVQNYKDLIFNWLLKNTSNLNVWIKDEEVYNSSIVFGNMNAIKHLISKKLFYNRNHQPFFRLISRVYLYKTMESEFSLISPQDIIDSEKIFDLLIKDKKFVDSYLPYSKDNGVSSGHNLLSWSINAGAYKIAKKLWLINKKLETFEFEMFYLNPNLSESFIRVFQDINYKNNDAIDFYNYVISENLEYDDFLKEFKNIKKYHLPYKNNRLN